MKLSISLSVEDVAVLDEHARAAGLPSRSAAVQQAIHLLRHAGLADEYSAAFTEWDGSGERDAWDATLADGFG